MVWSLFIFGESLGLGWSFGLGSVFEDVAILGFIV